MDPDKKYFYFSAEMCISAKHIYIQTTYNCERNATQKDFIGCPSEISAIIFLFHFELTHISALNCLFDMGLTGRSKVCRQENTFLNICVK